MSDQNRRPHPRYVPGMVYAVPLSDGTYGLAQSGIAVFPHVISVALFSGRIEALHAPTSALTASAVVSLTATWRRDLNKGDWVPLGLAALTEALLDHPSEVLASKGYVGFRHCDAEILSDFLSAYHGLLPWNSMHDPKFFDTLLAQGVSRPQWARILGEDERAAYRRDVLGVDA